MLTVVTFCWQGWRPVYTPQHVANLRNMFRKHLTIPHRFVCVTDRPEDIGALDGVEAFPIWPSPVRDERIELFDCYLRLRLFDDWAKCIGERLLQIDLDVTIRGNIDDLITDDPIKVARLNSRGWIQGGMWLCTPGACPELWSACHDDELVQAARIDKERIGRRVPGSDQSLMNYILPKDTPCWTEEDGIWINDFRKPWRILFRTGNRKPWDKVPERRIYMRESKFLPDDADGVEAKAMAALDALDTAICRIAEIPIRSTSIAKRQRYRKRLAELEEIRAALERAWL